jgi:predicted nucleic acid-binding protein
VILVDTSVWVEHLRRGSPRLAAILANRGALQHPFVTGELALGGLPLRERMLAHLADLPAAPIVDHAIVLRLLEVEHLYGRGLGWVDVHLLASSLHSRCGLWTNDRSLARTAHRLGIAA